MTTADAASAPAPAPHEWALARRREIARFLLAALGYALGVWCAKASSVPPNYMPPVWPANPVLLTALLFTPTGRWWPFLLIPFAADPIWWSAASYPWQHGLLSSMANCIEVTSIACVLRYTGVGVPNFGRLRQAGLYFAAAAASIFLAAAFGALSLRHPTQFMSYPALWRGWYVADLLSHFTLSPFLLTWARSGPVWLRKLGPRRHVEGVILLACLVPTVLIAFAAQDIALPGVIYLPLPFLLWAALRFGVLGTYAALSLTAILAIWHVASGLAGPAGFDASHEILAIQSFLIATAVPMAILTAVLCEREDVRDDLVRYSEVLSAAKDEAQAANKAKDEFLGVLSHELRTPLTPILLTASVLDTRPDLPADVREDVRTIRRSVELEARLIDDLLDVTRIARGKLELRKETIDVHVAAEQASRLCCRGERTQSLEIDLRAGSHHACVDPARLQQVLWNLLNNAVKFTPPDGRITIRSYNVPPDRLRIEVADTGIGIAPEVLPKLFTAFEQGATATTRRFGGLGLGLAISRAIAKLHGGTLTASSPGSGRGATFTLDLPTVPAPIAPAATSPSSQSPPAPASATGRHALRILLVEDNPLTLKILTRFLRSLGHHVRPADSQQAALAADREEEFDLVVSDLGLPDGSGHRLMRELRRRHTHLPGIAVSGYGAEEDIRQSQAAGFSRHLTKPVTIEQLESVIEQVAV